MIKLVKNNIDDIIADTVNILILAYLTLHIINKVHFYLYKSEINAKIIDLIENRSGKYDKVVLEFPYKKQKLTISKSIKRGVYEEIKGKSNVIIFYDDFLINDLYFKDRHPYFTLGLIIYFVVYFIVLLPLLLKLRLLTVHRNHKNNR